MIRATSGGEVHAGVSPVEVLVAVGTEISKASSSDSMPSLPRRLRYGLYS